MRHFFLVDYENVKEKGLDGFFSLSKKDRVYVFYSVNQQKISMDFVSVLKTKRNLPYIEYVFVKAGKQSLDMQLSSFLGSLIAENGIRRCDYTIISADRDFLPVVDFWNRRNGSSCVHEFASIEKYLKKDDTPDDVKTIREKTPVAGRTPSSARTHYEKSPRSGEEKKTERRYEDHRRERSEQEKVRTDSRRREEKAAEGTAEPLVLTALNTEPAPEAGSAKKETEKPRTQKTRRSRSEKSAQESVKETVKETETAKEDAVLQAPSEEPSEAAVSAEPVLSPEPAAAPEEERIETEPAAEKKEETVSEETSPEGPAAEETAAEEEALDPGENRPSRKPAAPKKKTASRTSEKTQTQKGTKEENGAETSPVQVPSPVNSKTLLNNRLQSALAKAQVDQKVAIEITHLVLSHMDEKNFKQIVYLEMIKKYRQAEGLSYYRIIQPVMQDAM